MVAELLERLKRTGVEIRVLEGNLHLRGQVAPCDADIMLLRELKPDVIKELGGSPAMSVGARHERLCRLMGEVVETRYGRGRVWQVFSNRVGVVIEPGEVTFMQPEDVYLEPVG